MSDIKLFSTSNGNVKELFGKSARIEKSLQTLIERNLEEFLGIRFLASEYSTGDVHKGRIDSLGIDENNCPVIIEYKRATNDTVILQSFYYLHWLLDHKAEFSMMVMNKYGKVVSDEINWDSPRVLCIAGGYTKYDTYAIQKMDGNVELYKYKYFDDDLFLLELVANSTSDRKESSVKRVSNTNQSTKISNTFQDKLRKADKTLTDLYEEINEHLLALGDDVQETPQKFYNAYKRIENFVCLTIAPQQKKITMYLKIDPENVELEGRLFRNVKGTNHHGTGDTELTITSTTDFEKVKVYVEQSYNNN